MVLNMFTIAPGVNEKITACAPELPLVSNSLSLAGYNSKALYAVSEDLLNGSQENNTYIGYYNKRWYLRTGGILLSCREDSKLRGTPDYFWDCCEEHFTPDSLELSSVCKASFALSLSNYKEAVKYYHQYLQITEMHAPKLQYQTIGELTEAANRQHCRTFETQLIGARKPYRPTFNIRVDGAKFLFQYLTSSKNNLLTLQYHEAQWALTLEVTAKSLLFRERGKLKKLEQCVPQVSALVA